VLAGGEREITAATIVDINERTGDVYVVFVPDVVIVNAVTRIPYTVNLNVKLDHVGGELPLEPTATIDVDVGPITSDVAVP
jgi:hypothetical protein